MPEHPVHDLTVHHVPIDQVLTYPGNARRGDVDAIAESMDVNGVFAPVVVQRSTGYVIDGNHRLKAMQRRRQDTVPVVYVDVDDEHARRIVLAANRTNDLASYDDQALIALLEELPDLTGTGYTDTDLADLIDALNADGPAPGSADYIDTPDEDNYVAQYAVTVVCRDEAHQEETYERLSGLGYSVKVVTV